MQQMDNGDTLLNQFLIFTLDEGLFALDIGTVREILDEKVITRVPRMPEEIRGVIDVRGHALPVMDLRRKFGLEPSTLHRETCVIVVEQHHRGANTLVGALVDSVVEVVELQPDVIDPPPQLGAGVQAEFLRGMARRDNRFVMILDGRRLFSSQETDAVARLAKEGETSEVSEEALAV